MLINIEVNNNVEIRSLNDLFILGRLQEVGSIKVNKSEIARELGVDRRTVSKYIDGYSKSDVRQRKSKIDQYYDVINFLSTGIKCCRFNVLDLYFKKSAMSDILLYPHFKPFENKIKKISRFGSTNKANLLLLSFHE